MNKVILLNVSPHVTRHLARSTEKFKSTPSTRFGVGRIDKLFIMTDDIDWGFLNENCSRTSYRSSRYYRQAQSYVHKPTGIEFQLFSRPRFPNIVYRNKIEINPSLYSSREFHSFLLNLLGPQGMADHFIKRVDCSVMFDSEIYPVDLFWHSTFLNRRRKSTRYRDSKLEYLGGVCSGFTCGSHAKRINVYDVDCREKKLFLKRNKDPNKTYIPIHKTNFEIQLTGQPNDPLSLPRASDGDSIQIKTLYDLKSLCFLNPFVGTNFFDLSCRPTMRTQQQAEKFTLFQTYAYAHGAHNARSLLNKISKGNFGRIQRTLSPLYSHTTAEPFESFLIRSFQQGISCWFGKKLKLESSKGSYGIDGTSFDLPT